MMMEEFHQVRIAYMRRMGPYGPENKQLMERFKAYLRENGLWKEEIVLLGIALDDPTCTPGDQQRYDVGCIVQEGCGIPLPQRLVADGPYAVFAVSHTQEAVQAFWRELPHKTAALPVDRTKPILERYRQKMVEGHLCEFCIPLLEEGEERLSVVPGQELPEKEPVGR